MHIRIAAFLVAGLAALQAGAQAEDFSKVEIKSSRVANGLYMLEGAGGNMAASIGEDGVVLVDDEFAPLAGKIEAALKSLNTGGKPLRFVINTHYHFDHTGSNQILASDGATLIAHSNVRARLATPTAGGNGGSLKLPAAKPAEAAALPVITFDHDVTVHANGEDIRAIYFPAGHTDGDSIIFFPKANVVHMGDDFVRYGFPFIDLDGGGSVEGTIKACEKALAQLPADVKVIPGHGALATPADVREYVKMLKDTSNAVRAAMKAGKSLEQMKKDQVLAAWSKRYSGDFISTDAFIETLYNDFSGRRSGAFVTHH